MSRYQKGKPIWILLKQETSEWQLNQLGRMQVCNSLQTDNHASTPPLHFLQAGTAGCPSCRPTNSVKALKDNTEVDLNCHLLRSQQRSRVIIATVWVLIQREDSYYAEWRSRFVAANFTSGMQVLDALLSRLRSCCYR